MADWQTAGLIGGVGCLVLVLSGLIARRVPLGQTVKMALAWIAIFLVAALVVGQRDQFARLWNDAFGGSQQVHGTAMRIEMAEDGHFWADAEVNGRPVRFMIDSGATITAMSRASAAAANIEISESGFPASIQTANGTVEARRASIDRLSLGSIQADDLAVVVAEEFGDTNVLGMNFLSQLESWRVEGRFLILQPVRP
jgi:aspartyl protease family protein